MERALVRRLSSGRCSTACTSPWVRTVYILLHIFTMVIRVIGNPLCHTGNTSWGYFRVMGRKSWLGRKSQWATKSEAVFSLPINSPGTGEFAYCHRCIRYQVVTNYSGNLYVSHINVSHTIAFAAPTGR